MARGGPRPGWYRDPTGRHELRRWDGDGWSEWVMDATRRNFDDIDGCGGPPAGEPVPVDGGGGITRLRSRAGGRARGGRSGGAAPSGSGLALGAGLDPGRALVVSLVTAAVAAVAALGVASLSEGGVVEALLSVDAEAALRRYAGPLVLAGVAFEVVLGVGLLVATRTNPFPSFRGITREEVLRGFITFLLALFAWTFFVGAIDGTSGDHWWPLALGWLFAVEVVLTVFVAPVLEERLFRGLLLVGLRERAGGPVLGVLASAAIYGLAHSWALRDASRPGTIIGMAAIGAVFGWMAHASNDLRPVIIGHMMFGAWVVLERLLGW